MNRTTPPRRANGRPTPLFWAIIALSVAMAATLLTTVFLFSNHQTPSPNPDLQTQQSDEQPETDPSLPVVGETEVKETDPPQTEPPVTYKDVTLLSAGDIMFHYPNLVAAYDSGSDSYRFDSIFQYLPDVLSKYDCAVANLETTLSGKDKEYTKQNSISFNAPDSALTAIQGAGFDLMLFANNHTYDRGIAGVKRTVSFLGENGMECIGAVDDTSKKAHKIVDISGVKVGMLNYTNDGSFSTYADGSINGITLQGDHADYINIFYLNDLEGFYQRVQGEIEELRQNGADLIVFYIHWGFEYQPNQHKKQTEIAQKLCDLGVDAILGSHPHVIQPMETLTSTADPEHKTVCFYSHGNFISNQNRRTLPNIEGSERTENGLMSVLTIRKYSTGQTLIVGVDTIPTWVHRYTDNSGKRQYRIIPLEAAITSPENYGLNDSYFGVSHATAALAMTKELIDSAVAAFNQSVTLPAGTENATGQ